MLKCCINELKKLNQMFATTYHNQLTYDIEGDTHIGYCEAEDYGEIQEDPIDDIADDTSEAEDYGETQEDLIDDIADDTSEAMTNGGGTKRKFLNNEERMSVSHILLRCTRDGKLDRETKDAVATKFSVSPDVIKRIWRQMKRTGDASHRKTKNCGRKRVDLDRTRFAEVPLSKRTTYRSLAMALNISTTSVFKYKKEGAILRHSNAIKPYLKEENMVTGLKFCLSMLDRDSLLHNPTFKSMHNIVHIDEKWFYMTKRSSNYLLLPGEEEPLRTCKSKNFIVKVMFLVAMARPRFDAQEPAKKASINRVAGTLETKPITSITKVVSKSFLIEKVIPAIKAKWPRHEIHEPIFIQQDNARSHINGNDPDFDRVAKEDGFNIHLMSQPANSPDLNILDLGFFNAIQSLQYKEAPRTIDELVDAVIKAFETFPASDSNKIFLTLQAYMIEIMKAKGSNAYKIPHIKKQVMRKNGQLPTQLKCDPLLVEEVGEYLRNNHRGYSHVDH